MTDDNPKTIDAKKPSIVNLMKRPKIIQTKDTMTVANNIISKKFFNVPMDKLIDCSLQIYSLLTENPYFSPEKWQKK